MVAMVAYGAMWAVFSATGPRIAHERAIGWTRQLRVTPLTPASALSGKLVTALAAALPAMLLVALTAVISHHVHLGAAQWLAMFAAMWVGVLPLALLGLAIGYLAGDEIAFPLTMALYFVFGALGGLWIPLSNMPRVMQDIGKVLPSNGLAQLGWRIAGGQAPVRTAVVVLAAWMFTSALAAFLAYRQRAIGASHRRGQLRLSWVLGPAWAAREAGARWWGGVDVGFAASSAQQEEADQPAQAGVRNHIELGD
jgi:ABC-2 type transport system permease protein